MGKHKRTMVDYPNAYGAWHGCPEDWDNCPFEDCTMPPEICAKRQMPICHGWILTADGVQLDHTGFKREYRENGCKVGT